MARKRYSLVFLQILHVSHKVLSKFCLLCLLGMNPSQLLQRLLGRLGLVPHVRVPPSRTVARKIRCGTDQVRNSSSGAGILQQTTVGVLEGTWLEVQIDSIGRIGAFVALFFDLCIILMSALVSP